MIGRAGRWLCCAGLWLCFGLTVLGGKVWAQTPAASDTAAPSWDETTAISAGRPQPRPEGLRTEANQLSPARVQDRAADAALGEWHCRVWYGPRASGYGRSLTMILEADGSWLLQGRGRDAGPFLVLGKWFRAPKGQIFGSGRETRVWDKRLGGLFALELSERDGKLISDEDPRAECRRP